MRIDWYVVWITTGREQETAEHLQHIDGVRQVLCPAREIWERRSGEWTLKHQVLFPGYIFLRCRMDSAVYYAIRELPGVMGWLGRDTLWPTSVRQEEMDAVLALDQGAAPDKVLTGVRISKRQRRGYGNLTLLGKEFKVPFNAFNGEAMQAEEAAGDASPQQTEPNIV